MPEAVERGAGADGAALEKTLRQHGNIDGADAGAADPLDGEAIVLEQAIEHAPGEGAVGAAPLERKIDPALLVVVAPLRHRRYSATAASAAARSSASC